MSSESFPSGSDVLEGLLKASCVGLAIDPFLLARHTLPPWLDSSNLPVIHLYNKVKERAKKMMLSREEVAILAIKSENKKVWQKYFLEIAKREAQKFIDYKVEHGYELSDKDVVDTQMINLMKEEMLLELMHDHRHEFFIIKNNNAFKMTQKLGTHF
jgi:hypothetical protein